MCTGCKKTAVKVYNATNQTVNTNSAISLLNSEYTNNSCNAISVNNNSITINQSGTYFVAVNANVLPTVNTGNISLQILNQGTNIPAAIASAGATDILENISINTLITVKPSCKCVRNNAVLTFLNTGVNATYTNIAINIFEI